MRDNGELAKMSRRDSDHDFEQEAPIAKLTRSILRQPRPNQNTRSLRGALARFAANSEGVCPRCATAARQLVATALVNAAEEEEEEEETRDVQR